MTEKLYYCEYKGCLIIKFIYIVQLQLQTFETMNFEVIKSITFANGKLLVET